MFQLDIPDSRSLSMRRAEMVEDFRYTALHGGEQAKKVGKYHALADRNHIRLENVYL